MSAPTWTASWQAPCNDPAAEFRAIQVSRNTTDRLISFPVQPAKVGNAMRVEVLQGDCAWNPAANGGQGAQIPGGWRAEAVGPEEHQSDQPVRYEWSTMFDMNYAQNPVGSDGHRIWQVVFQFHQGDNDQGGSPPVAFIIVNDKVYLDAETVQSGASVQVGQWPIADLNRGTWHDFAAEIKWHPTDGTIKVWYDGQPVTFDPVPSQANPGSNFPQHSTDTLTGLTTLFPPQQNSPDPSSVYMKAGLYRKPINSNPSQTFVLYHDEIKRLTQ
jgi:hypothetical protein